MSATSRQKAAEATSSAETIAYNLYFSSSVEGELGNLLGAPHYSYRFAEAKFTAAISVFAPKPQKLLMPEYYNTVSALPQSTRDDRKPDVHLIFRSTEQIRLLKFAWNICCFAWEFDVLKSETEIDEHPFLNQKRMLTLCDELWVPCTYTKNVLESYQIKTAHVIPAPIRISVSDRPPLFESLAHLGHILVAPLHHNFLKNHAQNSASCGEGSLPFIECISRRLKQSNTLRIYLTILNPEDFRKNLDAMLRAFYYFSRSRTDVLLVVKVLTSASRFNLLEVLSDVIPKKLASGTAIESNNIVFFNDFLSEDQMSYLYGIADFYLCASLCEGQNLPLLEAMGHGVVPITTANTAMSDYINNENAIVIRDHSVPNDIVHLAGTIANRPFSIHRSRAEDIYNALCRSLAMKPRRYAALSDKAKETVKERFSPKIVWAKIRTRLEMAGPGLIARQTLRRKPIDHIF